jgi:ribosomal protein S18 acetylase RimI-like enzyme
MIDFSNYTARQVVDFIDENFQLFANDRCDEFPKNVIRHLNGDLLYCITRKEGFAFVDKGINEVKGFFPGKNADLMFLYVQPEFEGMGIGAKLIEEAKVCLSEARIMDVSCEGEKRFRYFESKGFELTWHDKEIDLYHLRWIPSQH